MKLLQSLVWSTLVLVLSFGVAGCNELFSEPGHVNQADDSTAGNAPPTKPAVIEVNPADRKAVLKVSSFGDGKISIDTGSELLACGVDESVCRFRLDTGTDVTLTPEAVPGSGYVFDEWDICDNVNGNVCRVTLTDDTLVAATFVSTAPLVINSDVYVLTKQQIRDIADYATNSNIIKFKPGTILTGIKVGNIIISKGYTASSPGAAQNSTIHFARRVTNIQKQSDNSVWVYAEPVPLRQIVKKGSISADWHSTTTTSGSQQGALRVVTVSPSSTAHRASPPPIDVDFANASITGNLNFDTNLDMDVDVGFFDLNFRVLGTFDTSGKLNVEIREGLSEDFDYEITEFSLGAATIGPVVLVPTIEVSLVGEVNAEASNRISVSPNFVVKGGVQYNEDWQDLSDFDENADAVFETIVARVGAEAGIRVRITIEVYDVAGPFVALTPGFGFEAAGFVPPKNGCAATFTFYGQVEGSAGVRVSVLAFELNYGAKLFDLEVPLFTRPCKTDTQPPTAPGHVVATPEDIGNIKLSWDKGTDNIDVGFYIVKRTSQATSDSDTFYVHGTRYFDSSLRPGTKYCYTLKSVDTGHLVSAGSASACAMTNALDFQPPSSPTKLQANGISSSEVKLTWNKATDNISIDGYIIKKQLPDDLYVDIARVKGNMRAYVDQGLRADTKHCYKVYAIDKSGNTGPATARSCAMTSAGDAGGGSGGGSDGGSDGGSGGGSGGAPVLLFVGNDDKTPDDIVDVGLWVSDGSTAGTQLLKDISYTRLGLFEPDFIRFGDSVFFHVASASSGNELWKTDLTRAGTQQVTDIRPGSDGSLALLDMVVFNGSLYFKATNGTSAGVRDLAYQLWKSDGTKSGTVQVTGDIIKDVRTDDVLNDIFPGARLTVVNGALYFVARDVVHGFELWRFDGTNAVMVEDIDPGSGSSSPDHFETFNGDLYFSASDGENGTELWKTVSTGTGAELLADLNPGVTDLGYPDSSYPGDLTVFKGALYFVATDGFQPFEIYRTDGAGIEHVTDGDSDSLGVTSTNILTVFKDELYFTAKKQSGGNDALYKLTTKYGVQLVTNINPGYDDDVRSVTIFDGMMYFTATDGVHGLELWKSDGTATGTRMVKDIIPGGEGSFPRNLTVSNGMLYFTADSGSGRGTEKLYKTNGTSVTVVKDVKPEDLFALP